MGTTSSTRTTQRPISKPSNKESSPTANKNHKAIEKLVSELKEGRYHNVIVMAGAGISTAAGIPDFRSPETGLYANLQRFKLPYPEAVFDIDYLRKNPEPFFMLAREMYPSQFQPTQFHEFLKWLSDEGCLKRVYTQNIDTLERRAGVPSELIVEAHGSFSTSSCIDCHTKASQESVEQQILEGEKSKVPHCTKCGGIVKSDIVFFGEGLPERFFDLIETDFDDCDLAIVAGTSLQVGPFNQLPDMVPSSAPRYLLNIERAGSLGQRKHDVLILGPLEDLRLPKRSKGQQTTEPSTALTTDTEANSKEGSDTKSEPDHSKAEDSKSEDSESKNTKAKKSAGEIHLKLDKLHI